MSPERKKILDESKDYLISTHILDKIRSEYKSL